MTEVFVKMHEKGYIYKGARIVNWCPVCNTSISDAEVEYQEQAGHFWHIKYPLMNEDGMPSTTEFLTFATTRPETMLGDTAVAIHPDDERYTHLPWQMRELTSAAHAQNLVVSVDTPVPQAYTMYYQRGEQARFVDYMIVMAYDEHFAGSEEAGSVSSLPFVQQAVEEMTRVMPADQVICGIPFYTRVWTEKFGQSAIISEVLGMDGAKNYAKENQMTETWDASLGQNVATVETSDARYTIWMEDEQSMEEKLKVIQSADLAGVAEWKLGFECADVWSLISEYIETNS